MSENIWMSWSTGKDSAFALFKLQQSCALDVKALLTTFNSDYSRVVMHATRIELLEKQSESLGLPLELIAIPKNCSNEIYEKRFKACMSKALTQNISKIAFGDLFLEDVKTYRERLFKNSPLVAEFPIWKRDTSQLANEIIQSGFEAYLTCVDPKKLSPSFAGRKFDYQLLKDLPRDVDPCGENGEFHTFVYNGPNFKFPISCSVGEVVERDHFYFADIFPN